jgi:hypothetical protein
MPESSSDIVLRKSGIGCALAQALAEAMECEAGPDQLFFDQVEL